MVKTTAFTDSVEHLLLQGYVIKLYDSGDFFSALATHKDGHRMGATGGCILDVLVALVNLTNLAEE